MFEDDHEIQADTAKVYDRSSEGSNQTGNLAT